MKNRFVAWEGTYSVQSIGKAGLRLQQIGLLLVALLFLIGLAGCSMGNISRLKMRGSSMEPNIHDGQVIKAAAVEDISSLQRGDIILFQMNEDAMMKRIIALPGETIEIRQGSILIDGKAYQEPYEVIAAGYDQEPVQLGEDEYYVLGDNRPESRDSHEFGPITGDTITGRIVSK
jgi:signal peptidase I